MKKKILIIGNSAKEYALAKKLSGKYDVYVTPSSDAIKEFATCLDLRDSSDILEFVMENGIELTVPLSSEIQKSDIVDLFNKNNQAIFAPAKNASKLVLDKAFAKKILYKLRIPTPKFGIFEKQNMAMDYIKNLKNPFVIKTDVANSATVFTNPKTAKKIVDSMFIEKNARVIIEDYIYGVPFSFYTITDGYKALPIGSSITYKHSLEGDGGQLTNGMGACSPNYKLTLEQEYYLMDNVIYPTLDYCEIEGNPYLGVLGLNGILTDDGRIFILGWQSFMQDCDATAVLDVLDEDLYKLFNSCVVGSFSDEIEGIKLFEKYSTSIVLACRNKENNENVIKGLDNLDEGTEVTFYPSVNKNKYLEYEANYGANIILTTSGITVAKAVNKMYKEVEDIDFNGIIYRKDICNIKI